MKFMRQHAEKCAYKERIVDGTGVQLKPCDCDGYHTFNELYEHRIQLWITLCEAINSMVSAAKMYDPLEAARRGIIIPVWRSKNHSDGEPSFGGEWFLLGIGKEKGRQITYHLPIDRWDETGFAETLDRAPEFDGHTSDDVINRLKSL